MRLSEARVGMEVKSSEKIFENAKIVCIHEDRLFLDRGEGTKCNKCNPGGHWVCVLDWAGKLTDGNNGDLLRQNSISDYFI